MGPFAEGDIIRNIRNPNPKTAYRLILNRYNNKEEDRIYYTCMNLHNGSIFDMGASLIEKVYEEVK